jgi:hypothetical protein
MSDPVTIKIESLDWRGALLARIRQVVNAVDPRIDWADSPARMEVL